MGNRVPAEFTDWPDTLTPTYGPYRAVCCHHIDGDTYDLLISAGFGLYGYHPVRLLSVDCPEVNRGSTREAGLAAKEYVKQIMPVGARVLLRTEKTDHFGRYLGRITLEGGFDLAQLILNAGHGVPA